MNVRINWIRGFIACLLFAFTTGCSTMAQGTSTSKPKAIPNNTPTPVPTAIPTNTPLAPTPTSQSAGITFEVTFDENDDCIVIGPTKVPLGEYLFVLDDRSELNLGLWVVQFHEGKTYQDLLDLQSEPGEYIEQPLWTTHPFNFTRDHETWTVSLDESGEHAIVLGSYSPKSVWVCYAFQVIEPLSE
jgi:hypothetical protein